MTVEVWMPCGIDEEHEVTVTNGETKRLDAFPFKWFTAELSNEGPDEVKVMKNATSLPKAITLKNHKVRMLGTDKKPTISRIEFYASPGKTATVRVTTSR